MAGFFASGPPIQPRHVLPDHDPHRRAHPVEVRSVALSIQAQQKRQPAFGVPAQGLIQSATNGFGGFLLGLGPPLLVQPRRRRVGQTRHPFEPVGVVGVGLVDPGELAAADDCKKNLDRARARCGAM